MAKKKPFRCPVKGCAKRGARSDLARHARAIHPEIPIEAYHRAIDKGLPLVPPRRLLPAITIPWARMRKTGRQLSAGLSGLVVVAALVWLLVSHAPL